jgi:hypothetical protein
MPPGPSPYPHEPDRSATAEDPADPVPGGALERGVDRPAEQKLRRVGGDVRADPAGEAVLVPGPDALDLGQHLVELATAL